MHVSLYSLKYRSCCAVRCMIFLRHRNECPAAGVGRCRCWCCRNCWLVAGLVVNISSDRGHTLVGARVPAPAPWKLKIASLHPAVARGHSPDSPLHSPSHHRHHDHTQTGRWRETRFGWLLCYLGGVRVCFDSFESLNPITISHRKQKCCNCSQTKAQSL